MAPREPAPARRGPGRSVKVVHAHGTLEVDRPLIMGVVNASPESFSDSETLAGAGIAEREEHALAMAEAGARLLDIGGQSARTDQPELPVGVEIERVGTLIESIRRASDVVISIDTYRPQVASAAVSAGASIVNDVSGLADPGLVEVVASSGAGLIVMHTRLAPRPAWRPRTHSPGPRSGGRRHRVLPRAPTCAPRGRRRLRASTSCSTRDPISPRPRPRPLQRSGAYRTWPDSAGRSCWPCHARTSSAPSPAGRPRARAAGTLAAIGFCVGLAPHSLLRVHDVEATRDYLAVLAALEGEHDLGVGRAARGPAALRPAMRAVGDRGGEHPSRHVSPRTRWQVPAEAGTPDS